MDILRSTTVKEKTVIYTNFITPDYFRSLIDCDLEVQWIGDHMEKQFYNICSGEFETLNQMELISGETYLTSSKAFQDLQSNMRTTFLADIALLKEKNIIKDNILDQSFKMLGSKNMIASMEQCFNLGIV